MRRVAPGHMVTEDGRYDMVGDAKLGFYMLFDDKEGGYLIVDGRLCWPQARQARAALQRHLRGHGFARAPRG